MWVVYLLVDGHKMYTGVKHKTIESAEKEQKQQEKGGYKWYIEKKE